MTGSTGKTGSRVAANLRAHGVPVRPGSRHAAAQADRFDWDDPTTWAPALDGVDAVYLTFQPDLALPGAPDRIGAFTDLAARRGVTRVTLLSGRGEPGARDSEAALFAGLPEATVLRCSWFNQNFTEGALRDCVPAGAVALPAPPERAEPFLDAGDIAACAAVTLCEPGHAGRVYELTGPRSLTLAEAAAELGRAAGWPVEYVPVSEVEFAAALAGDGLPADQADFLAHLFAQLLDGRNSATTGGVPELLGRPARTFADFSREAGADGAWELSGPGTPLVGGRPPTGG